MAAPPLSVVRGDGVSHAGQQQPAMMPETGIAAAEALDDDLADDFRMQGLPPDIGATDHAGG